MSRFVAIAGFLFLLSALTPLPGVKPAYACSCAYSDPEELVKFADVIVVGTVDGIQIPPHGPNGIVSSRDPVFVSVTVERYLKGSGGFGLEFSTARWGASCGTLEILDEGERHVLFLKEDDSNYTTGLCSGNASIGGVSLSGIDGEKYLTEIEAITGQGTSPEGKADTLDDPESNIGFMLPWGLVILGLVGGLAVATGGALIVRRRWH